MTNTDICLALSNAARDSEATARTVQAKKPDAAEAHRRLAAQLWDTADYWAMTITRPAAPAPGRG